MIRDLFRKSGRPVERELDLVQLDVLREHRFEDGTVVTLLAGRAAQIAAFDASARPGPAVGGPRGVVRRRLGRAAPQLPRDALGPRRLPRDLAARLGSREVLHKRLRRTFRDDRLRMVAGHPFVAEGHDLRNVPAWAGVTAYVEQRFGAWTVTGGMAALATALGNRLVTRRVTVETGTAATDLVLRDGRVVAVRTASGDVDADVVVCAIDPRRLPALAGHVRRTMPAIPPVVSYLGLEGDVPDLPHEVVLHGDPMLVVRPGGTAPEGCTAWTVHGRGRLAEDLLSALARHRIDVRAHVVTRVDCSPADLVERWGGSR